MLREIFIESLLGDATDKIIGVTFWVMLMIAFTGMVCFIDSSLADAGKKAVIVTNKKFVKAHATFITQITGNQVILTPLYHPDSWYISVINDKKQSDCSVGYGIFSEVKVGDAAYANVGSGLISSKEYCKEFLLISN